MDSEKRKPQGENLINVLEEIWVMRDQGNGRFLLLLLAPMWDLSNEIKRNGLSVHFYVPVPDHVPDQIIRQEIAGGVREHILLSSLISKFALRQNFRDFKLMNFFQIKKKSHHFVA